LALRRADGTHRLVETPRQGPRGALHVQAEAMIAHVVREREGGLVSI
jgi:hypothetical protein